MPISKQAKSLVTEALELKDVISKNKLKIERLKADLNEACEELEDNIKKYKSIKSQVEIELFGVPE